MRLRQQLDKMRKIEKWRVYMQRWHKALKVRYFTIFNQASRNGQDARSTKN